MRHQAGSHQSYTALKPRALRHHTAIERPLLSLIHGHNNTHTRFLCPNRQSTSQQQDPVQLPAYASLEEIYFAGAQACASLNCTAAFSSHSPASSYLFPKKLKLASFLSAFLTSSAARAAASPMPDSALHCQAPPDLCAALHAKVPLCRSLQQQSVLKRCQQTSKTIKGLLRGSPRLG